MSRKKGLIGMLLFLFILAAMLYALLPWALAQSARAQSEAAATDTARLSQDQPAPSLRLPILMYHHLSQNPAALDDYTISPQQLEQDLTALKGAGWTPISLQALIAYGEGKRDLPSKPVLLVFDDGYRSFLTLAFPLLQAHDVPAVVSVIGQQAEAAQNLGAEPGAFMNWDELRYVAQSGLVALQSHSAGLHVYHQRPGAARLPCESEDAYRQVLLNDIQRMTSLCGQAQISLQPAFAYPYGQLDALAQSILEQSGFLVTMTSEEHVNRISPHLSSLQSLGRLNRSGSMDTQEVLAWMEGAS